MRGPDETSSETESENAFASSYDAATTESRWYSLWEQNGVFAANVDEAVPKSQRKKPYVIMMPPPNVTGTLHNGHALFVTLQDILIRHHRMLGENALWLPGVDHAGIATQAVVERELQKREGKKRRDIGRDAFLEHVWDWKEKNGARIVEQMKALGASADWSKARFTMDEQCSRAVRHAFVQLWNDGLIYRGERLVNWDPATRTALSNEEVDHEDREGQLWKFSYQVWETDTAPTERAISFDAKGTTTDVSAYVLDDDAARITVATTRPETMLGDTAVAVHPDDPRYRGLVGKRLLHPFFPERKLIVVADESVDREFGSGAVKITPAHDPNDFALGERHALPSVNIFTLDADVNENGSAFRGLNRFVARDAVKSVIRQLNLHAPTDPAEPTTDTQKINHSVSISQRSGEPVEPMLSRQYFVSARPLAEMAAATVVGSTVVPTTPQAMDFASSLGDDDKTRILPDNWVSTFDHFVGNIRDWCVSRQLWWGHRIPVFYDLVALGDAIRSDAQRRATNTSALALLESMGPRAALAEALNTLDDELVRTFSIASEEELERLNPERFVQEEDVLDTWFSSGLWPFSTLGWPDKTPELDEFYPGAVLETGFDILFFWVARMMMFGAYFMKRKPFDDVYLHAMVRDANGKKMSKSLGNAIDPLDVVYGITKDALLEKTKTYPVPEKLLPKVLKGIEQEYRDGIPASGADGLRFSLAALSGQGRDVKLAIPRIAGYRAFLNKIWNATRFAHMRLEGVSFVSLNDVEKNTLSLADRWILSRLSVAVDKTHRSLLSYRFDDAANTIYQFFWTEFCDWYLEFIKPTLRDDAPVDGKSRTASVVFTVLDVSMRLLHPLCPFISEEIWQRLPRRQERWPNIAFCAVAPYPKATDLPRDEAAEHAFARLAEAVTLIRNARQESGLGAQQRVDVVLRCDTSETVELFKNFASEFIKLASLSSLKVVKTSEYEPPRVAAVNTANGFEVVVPLDGLIDVSKEIERLQKEAGKLEKDRSGIEKRLSNAQFVSNAPPEVVDDAKRQISELVARERKVSSQISRLSS